MSKNEDKKKKFGFSSFSFDSFLDNAITETGRKVSNATINPVGV